MIFGQELGLKPIEESDLERLAWLRNMPEVHQGFFNPFYFSFAHQQRWYANLLESSTRIMFMVVRLADGQIIGAGGLDNIDWRNYSAEVGSVFVDPVAQGYNYAVDIGRMVINYGFNEMNMNRIYARIIAYNQPALKTVRDRIGLQMEGVARKSFFSGGQFHDVVLLSVLRQEWQTN